MTAQAFRVLHNVEDPLTVVGSVVSKLATIWLRASYPFQSIGTGTSIHYSCDISRRAAKRMVIGSNVYVAPHVWLNVPTADESLSPAIVIGRGCKIGRRSMISANNLVCLEEDVLLAPGVLLMDHSHRYSNHTAPIHSQGVTTGGAIRVGRNCWLGYNAAIVCSGRELCIGENCVVGANAVVTHSIPPYSVVAGNPAKVIRSFDSNSSEWVRRHEVLGGRPSGS